MKYTCIKCNKEFTKKHNYDVHINRKYPCDKNRSNNNINDDVVELLPNHSQNIVKVLPKYSNLLSNCSQNVVNILPNILNTINNINTKTNKYQCKICNKISRPLTAYLNYSRSLLYPVNRLL